MKEGVSWERGDREELTELTLLLRLINTKKEAALEVDSLKTVSTCLLESLHFPVEMQALV